MLHETLKRLRDRSGLSLEELHDETTYDRSYLHKLETGAAWARWRSWRRSTRCTAPASNCNSYGSWPGTTPSAAGTSGS
ncbi:MULTISPECIES: helix-turn-helix domain-containing protein [unclassified Streptomyces]